MGRVDNTEDERSLIGMSAEHDSTTSQEITKRDKARTQENLRRILSYQLVVKYLTDMRKDLTMQADLEPGESIQVETPWGAKLGSISRSATKTSIELDDEAVLLGNADESEITYAAEQSQELVDYLSENAPEFLRAVVTDAGIERQRNDAKSQWERTGRLPIGWRIVSHDSSPRATATNLAKDIANDVLCGPLDDLLQIEPGEK